MIRRATSFNITYPKWISRRRFNIAAHRPLDRGAAVRNLHRLSQNFRIDRDTGPRAVQRILFIKFAEQGSTVLAYPAIRRATEMVGRENVYFIVFEDNRFILDVMKIIPEENVITISMKSPFALALGALRAIFRARKFDIDAAIDMEFLTRFSAMLTFLSGAKSRVGFHTFFGDGPYRGDLMTHRLLYNPHIHTSQMFEAMVEALTRDPARCQPSISSRRTTKPSPSSNPLPERWPT